VSGVQGVSVALNSPAPEQGKQEKRRTRIIFEQVTDNMPVEARDSESTHDCGELVLDGIKTSSSANDNDVSVPLSPARMFSGKGV